jgi:hypothetical protein
VKNSFGHAHISGADEFAPPERAKIELLSRIEGRFRVKDEAMAGPHRRPSAIPGGLRADTGVCPHKDVVTFLLWYFSCAG